MYFRDLLFNSKPNPGYIAINATYGAAVVQGANAKPPISSKYDEDFESVDSAGLSEAVTCAGNQISL